MARVNHFEINYKMSPGHVHDGIFSLAKEYPEIYPDYFKRHTTGQMFFIRNLSKMMFLFYASIVLYFVIRCLFEAKYGLALGMGIVLPIFFWAASKAIDGSFKRERHETVIKINDEGISLQVPDRTISINKDNIATVLELKDYIFVGKKDRGGFFIVKDLVQDQALLKNAVLGMQLWLQN